MSGETLAGARDHCEAQLGLDLLDGGQHAVFNTHNALLGLDDGLYLEAIAIDPDRPDPDRARWFDLDRFAGPARLTNWICRTDDMEATLARLPVGVGAPVALSRGDLRWRMAVPETGVLPFDNIFPAIIQWESELTPPRRLPASGARLQGLTVQHPRASDLQELLGLEDSRVIFRQGTPGLAASFETPGGLRIL